MLRTFVLILLALGMAGFGVCSLCGGFMAVSMFTEARASSRDIAWLAFGCSAVGVLLTWLCWLGFQAVRHRSRGDLPAVPPRSNEP